MAKYNIHVPNMLRIQDLSVTSRLTNCTYGVAGPVVSRNERNSADRRILDTKAFP